MARKRDLANKLSQSSGSQADRRPGWRDAITGPARDSAPEPEREESQPQQRQQAQQRSSRLKRKTYLLTPELIEHVADLAETERVGINELVRYLLRASLEMVEAGELPIPTRPATREIVRGE